jgi:hypothetical protein
MEVSVLSRAGASYPHFVSCFEYTGAPTRRLCRMPPVRLYETVKARSEASVLSADEIVRASRFHSEQDRVYFTRRTSALQSLRPSYFAIPATEIRFEYLTSGEPQLAADQNSRALQFEENLF